jgi:hypothetical protein
MRPIRFHMSTLLMIAAIVAALIAFRRLKSESDFWSIVPFDILTVLLTVILVTFCLMLQTLWRK